MHERDIPRWTDHGSDVPPALRDALGAARAEAPTDAQIERWIAGAQAALTNGGAVGSTLTNLHRLWIALGVASLLGLGAFAASQLVRTSPSSGKPAAELKPAATPEPAAAPEPAATPERLPQPTAAPAPASPEPVSELQPTTASAPAPQQARRSPSARSKVVPADQDPTAEVLLLREAKRALPRAPERAESLLREHLAKYPQGAFAEERDALRIESDWLLGRTTRARADFERFRKRHANSPYLRRLEHILVLEDPGPR